MQIAGKQILLTGASSGIGAALAAELSSRGAKLAVVGRNEQALAEAAPSAVAFPGDLADQAFLAALPARVAAEFGPVDILINNAGVGLYQPSWQADPALVQQMFAVNFFAPLQLTQHFVPGMVARRQGLVVNIASIAAKVNLPWFTLYSATKAALESFTDGLRMELRGTGVQAMLVCPGYVKTKFQQNVLGGHPPDRLASGKKFATTAPDLARAVANGIEAGKRTVMVPRSGWALVAAYDLARPAVEASFARIMEEKE